MATQISIPKQLMVDHPHCFALEVDGQCMEPDIPDGSVVVVDPDSPLAGDGREVAVIGVDSTLYVCRPLTVSDQVVMLHDNPIHFNAALPTERVRIAGKVIWVERGLER